MSFTFNTDLGPVTWETESEGFVGSRRALRRLDRRAAKHWNERPWSATVTGPTFDLPQDDDPEYALCLLLVCFPEAILVDGTLPDVQLDGGTDTDGPNADLDFARDTFLKHFGPGPHASGTPQSIHGAWAHGTSARQLTERIRQDPSGGTVDPLTGTVPTTGYQVATVGNELRTTPSDPRLVGVVSQSRNASVRLGAKFGWWTEEETGILYIEPSENIARRREAERIGRQRNQLAIWDVRRQREISTRRGQS